MSRSPNPSLSNLQRGILTEIGISQWKLEDVDRLALEQAFASKRAAVQSSEPSSEQVSDTKAAPTQDAVSENPLAENPVENSEPAKDMISMPGKILFAWSESLFPVWFTQDLLQALAMDENEIEYIDSESSQRYQDHALLCLSGDKLAYDGKQLTLPVLAAELSPSFKKELWEALAQYHGN